ncbi:hypothetical protein [Bosea sp. UNC402CLCol]|uniref:hypothetical protein n=1 Tax=Bosea sp. UNC402CLCol TaxID=1510531 RepID=UPI0005718845|nr:hypothetical protein [Bosea sp. UNC402CLCol]
MNRIILALVALGSLALADCQTLDSQIAQVSDRLSARCADLQTAALTVDLFAPEKVRAAA